MTEVNRAIEIFRDWNEEPFGRFLLVKYLTELEDLNAAVQQAEILNSEIRENLPWEVGLQWYALACIESSRGDFDSAVTLFERACERSIQKKGGKYTFLHLSLAHAYLEADRTGDAVILYEWLLNRFDPNLFYISFEIVRAKYFLGQAYEKSGWNDKAIEQYETFLDIWKDADPGIPEVEDARDRLARLHS